MTKNILSLILGLDLMDMGSDLMTSGSDPSRQAHKLRKLILYLQESFVVIEKCPQPVIAAVHSACVGGGVDMVSNCDIRLCSVDAWFQVKVLTNVLSFTLHSLLRPSPCPLPFKTVCSANPSQYLSVYI